MINNIKKLVKDFSLVELRGGMKITAKEMVNNTRHPGKPYA